MGGKRRMKQWLLLLMVLVALAGTVISWANQLDSPLPADVRADFVVIEKSKRELTIYREGKAIKTYPVALGRVPVGPKTREGDKKTPEGQYRIDYRKADSGYFRALHISYPSQADIETATKEGAAPGGDVMIHGLRNGLGWLGKLHRFADWTLGCVAVTDEEMEELWRAVPDGTPVELRP
jgi:murein L,D-transpeptidase YafK